MKQFGLDPLAIPSMYELKIQKDMAINGEKKKK